MEYKTEQYRDIVTTVSLPQDLKEEKRARRYLKIVQSLKIVAECALMFLLVTVFRFTDLESYAALIVIATLAAYICYRLISVRQFQSVLLRECNPLGFLARYGALIAASRNKSGWPLHFYNLAMGYYYAGKIEEALKVQGLLRKYCPSLMGRIYDEMLGAQFAAYNGDFDAMTEHCTHLKELRYSVKLKGTVYAIYVEKMTYPMLAQMYKKGSYENLYEAIRSSVSKKKSMLSEVKKNYYLYQVSKLMGNDEQAEVHRAFVEQNGGGLWFKEKIER